MGTRFEYVYQLESTDGHVILPLLDHYKNNIDLRTIIVCSITNINSL